MQDIKLSRRLAASAEKRLGELDFSQVKDGRQGTCKWSIATILKQVLIGMMAGKKGLAEIEENVPKMSSFMKKVLGFHQRIPDTTMGDALLKVGLDSLRVLLHQTVFLAIRRKALEPVGLPFHIVALDGKKTSTWLSDKGKFAQELSDYEGEHARFSVATITACLISSVAKLCLDAIPMPAETSESGFFETVLLSLIGTYGKLFKMVTYDAGANSKANADLVASEGLFYLFAVKGEQPTIFGRAKELLSLLGADAAKAFTQEILSGKEMIRRVWISTEMTGFHGWGHLKTVLRVESRVLNQTTGKLEIHSRYFVSNAPADTLTPGQWLLVIRSHWAVENNCHNTFDKIFQEDKRPFLRRPQGMLVAMILRRIAYNLLSLFRCVTQRSDEKKKIPWKSLMDTVFVMLIKLEKHHLVPGNRFAKKFGVV